MLKFLVRLINHLKTSTSSSDFQCENELNLSLKWVDPKILPKKLLNNPSKWNPKDAGIDEDYLLRSHPELTNAKSLIESGLLEKILCGEKNLYTGIPPINLSAYLDGLRRGAKDELKKHNLSALEHLATFGRERFEQRQPLGKDIDRYQPNNKKRVLPIHQDIEKVSQILIVLSSQKDRRQKCIKTNGWTKILYGDINNLKDIWRQLQLSTQNEALISFCHASDQINNLASHHILLTFNKRPELSLLTSDEDFHWSQNPYQPPGNLQNRSRLTPWRLISRGAIGGLVTMRLQTLNSLDLPDKKSDLHGLLLELCLQIILKDLTIDHISECLLTRDIKSNPLIPEVASPKDWLYLKRFNDKEWSTTTQKCIQTILKPGASIHSCSKMPGCHEIRWNHSLQENILVSIMIPFRDKSNTTKLCIDSIRAYAGKTSYEIILINNGSQEPETLAWLDEQKNNTDTKVITIDCEFNYAKIHNHARNYCRGNYLLFLNNDIEFKSNDILQHLLNPFGLSITTAVGARLLYPNKSIQHQGVVIIKGERRCVLEPGKYLSNPAIIETLTPLRVQEEFTAATGACLMVKAADYDAIGGFDEQLAVVFNDVDLCLRLRNQGKSIVVTPKVEIIHHESLSRGKDQYGASFARHQRESGYLRFKHRNYFRDGDPLFSEKINPHSTRYQPHIEVRSAGSVREKLISTWRRNKWQPSSQRPIIMFAHFDSSGRVRPDIFPLLEQYNKHGDIVFISSSPALKWHLRTRKKLQKHCCAILIRHNEGYDFGSWMTGLNWIKNDIPVLDSLILTNDSFWGPISPLDDLFQQINASKASVIGLTDDLMYFPHLQSAFLSFRKDVLASETFWKFWDELEIWPRKRDLVKHCEVGLSVSIEKSGFKLESLFTKNSNGNVLHSNWRQLIIEQNFPFLKVSLLRDNPTRQNVDGWEELISAKNKWLANQIQQQLSRKIKSQKKQNLP